MQSMNVVEKRPDVDIKKFVSSGLFWYLFLLIVFFMSSLTIKHNNVEALRPLFYYSLPVLSIPLMIFISSGGAISNMLRAVYSTPSKICIIFMVYYLTWAFLSDIRQIKDFLYFSHWFACIFLTFWLMRNHFLGHETSMVVLTRALRDFALFAGFVAIGVYNGWIELRFWNLDLYQLNWVGGRIYGLLGEPTSFGALTALGLLSTIYLQFTRPSKGNYFAILILTICLLLSGSRNAILSFCIAGVILMLLAGERPVILKCALAMVIGVLVHYFYIQEIMNIIDRILFSGQVSGSEISQFYRSKDMILDRTFTDFSGAEQSSRLAIWSHVIHLIAQHEGVVSYVFGSGPNALRSEYRSGFNTALEVLYDFGVVGLIAICLWCFFTAKILLSRFFHGEKDMAVAMAFLVFSVVFAQFWVVLPRAFFNFPFFAFVIAFATSMSPSGASLRAAVSRG